MKFYSWKDVERFFFKNEEQWRNILDKVEVYPDSVVLYSKRMVDNKIVLDLLRNLFPSRFEMTAQEEWMIHLDIKNSFLMVILEKDLSFPQSYPIKPLFRDVIYRKSAYPDFVEGALPHLKCPVIAFHSYKGGVGRTLSLLAFARAWSEIFSEKEKKLLIVDADIEAPGLTWLNQDNMIEDSFSYLDLLDILQDSPNVETVVALVKEKIYTSSIKVMTDKQSVAQMFLPTYRYTEQLLDMYATPNTIVNSKGKRYALADTLSKIGESLGVSAILVDLRAGLSDYSATLLFDPRVKKYLVTSTSEQSIRGTELLLEFLNRGLPLNQDTVLPEIFLNMVMDNLNNSSELDQIVDRLKKNYDKEDPDEDDKFIDNFLTKIPFASELVHLSSLEQIFRMMSDRMMFSKMKDLIRTRYGEPTADITKLGNREEVLTGINKLASAQLVAENASEFKMLTTKPLQFLLQRYKFSVPQTIITGAKGSGKTFLYSQMVQEKSWEAFCRRIQADIMPNEVQAYFLPVLTTQTPGNLKTPLQNCVVNCRNNVSAVEVNDTAFIDNANSLQKFKDSHEASTESDWIEFWDAFFAKAINPEFEDLKEANEIMRKENKKVVLLIDGLEEIFKNVGGEEAEKMAISSLCKNIINQIEAKYPYIGIIVFLRHDMAQDAISVNFTQFMNVYGKFSLKWTQEEALRLALWLVTQAYPEFIDASVDIVSATRDVVEENLVRLWGLKLGKNSSNEAYTSRWILAALSDFNGQLQARDVIRFLKNATQNSGQGKTSSYDDRYILPQNVREAVIQCSAEKISEIEQEYHTLKPIFEKMRKHEPKTLPIADDINLLTMKEQQSLESAGFLKNIGNRYYLPEIIRHALGYRYEKGARPKVLSLLLGK